MVIQIKFDRHRAREGHDSDARLVDQASYFEEGTDVLCKLQLFVSEISRGCKMQQKTIEANACLSLGSLHDTDAHTIEAAATKPTTSGNFDFPCMQPVHQTYMSSVLPAVWQKWNGCQHKVCHHEGRGTTLHTATGRPMIRPTHRRPTWGFRSTPMRRAERSNRWGLCSHPQTR